MPVALQKKLIQWIFCPISRVSEKIPYPIREIAFSLSVLGIILLSFARGSGFYNGRYLLQYLVAWCFLGIMILAGLSPNLKPHHFSPLLSVFWLGVSLFMLLTGILVETNALAGAITWLGMFPVFYIVWGNTDFDWLVSLTLRGVFLSFLVFATVSILFYPMNSINYASFFTNRNGTGQYLAAVFVCLLEYILSRKSHSFFSIAAIIALGFVSATIYYTSSRTAIVASAFCFFCAALFQLYIHKKNWQRILLYQLIPIIAAVVVSQPLAIHIYQGGYQLASLFQTIGQQQMQNTSIRPSDTQAPSDTPAQPSEPSAHEVLDEMKEYTSNRLGGVKQVMDESTAERIMLWRIHLREVGFLGNPSDKTLYRPDGKVESRSAHFTIIQFAYDYGAISGICFLLVNLLAGLASIRFALRRRELRYCLFPFAVAIVFGSESVMEAIGRPMIDSLSFLYFLSLTPLAIVPSFIPENKESSKKVLYVIHGELGRVSSGSGVRPAAMYYAFLERGWDVHLLSGHCGRGEGKQRRSEVRKAMAWLQKDHPDFCYIESSTYPMMYHCDYALVRLLWREKIPTAYFYRDFFRRFPSLFPRRSGLVNKLKEVYLDFLQWRTDAVLNNVDLVYFPSEACFRYFHYRHMRALPPAGQLSASALNSGFVPDCRRTSIYVGGVSEVYGTPMLLEAFSILNENGVQYPLILVCREGEFEDTFPNFTFPAWLKLYHAFGKELEPLYALASLGLLTLSPNEYTQMAVGSKLFQYISYGLPVLSTDAAAMKSLIDENEFGRTAPYEAHAFAAAVKAMLDDQESLLYYQKKAIRNLRKKHLWVHRVDQIADDLLGLESNIESDPNTISKEYFHTECE